MKRYSLVATLALVALLAPIVAHAAIGVPQPRQQALDLIVTYADAGALNVRRDFPGLDRFERLDRIPGERAVLKFRTRAALEAALAELQSDPDVTSVEVAEVVTAQFVPNDPLYSNQWGPPLIGLEEANDIETGDPNVLVAVVDSVADCSHPDLAANCRPDLARDYNGGASVCQHGYHVAGIAAAVTDNGVGVAGLAGVGIVPLRFLGGNCSGSTADALLAWNYTLELASQGHRVVVNNSWGGSGFSQAHQDALHAMRDAGIVSVAAAGNGGSDGVGDNLCSAPVYPVSYASVLGAASIDEDEGMSRFSNFGNCANGAEVGAPGGSILSTCASGTYCQLSGTSMASPHVAGQAALILSTEPDATVDEVEARILDTVVPLPELATTTVAGGRIHLPESLGEPEPGIRLSLACEAQTVPQEETLDCLVSASGRGGYEGVVDLTCSGVPAATCTLEDDSIDTGDSTGLALTPSTGTPVGGHTLLVNGTSGAHEAEAAVPVEVFPVGTVTVVYEQTESIVLVPGGVAVSAIDVPVSYDVLQVELSYLVTCFPPFNCSASFASPDGATQPLQTVALTGGGNKTVLYTEEFDGFRPAGEWRIEARAPAKRFGEPNQNFRIWPWELTIIGVPEG